MPELVIRIPKTIADRRPTPHPSEATTNARGDVVSDNSSVASVMGSPRQSGGAFTPTSDGNVSVGSSIARSESAHAILAVAIQDATDNEMAVTPIERPATP